MGWPSDTPVEVDAYGGEIFWAETTVAVADSTDTPVVPPEHDDTIRVAISEDEVLTEAEVNAGTSFPNGNTKVPVWAGGRRFLYFGVPENSRDITDIKAGGLVSVLHAYKRVPGVLHGHKWWKSKNDQSDAASNSVYEVDQ